MTGGLGGDDPDLEWPSLDEDFWSKERRRGRRRQKKERSHPRPDLDPAGPPDGVASSAETTSEPPAVPPAPGVNGQASEPAGAGEVPAPPAGGGATGDDRPDEAGAVVNHEQRSSVPAEGSGDVVDTATAGEEVGSRAEQVSSSLTAEVAEITQAVADEMGRHAARVQEAVRADAARISGEIDALGKTIAGLRSSAGDTGSGPSAANRDLLGQATERVEALLEDLLVALENRPADVSELTARVMDRFAVAVGQRVEAATTTAIDTLDHTVGQALARAADQFKQLAPPMSADRSTTSALERLEERVAALSRQREADAAETRQVLEALAATVVGLKSAHADDLQRVIATVKNTRPPAAPDGVDDRVTKLADAVAAIADLPSTTRELVSIITQQTEALNTELEAVRRRLSLRARTTLDQASLEQLADLVAKRLREQA